VIASVVYWSEFLATHPEVRDRFPALLNFLRSSGSGLENWEYCRRDPLRWLRDTLYPQKVALTSSISGGLSVDVVCSRAQATEFSFFNFFLVLTTFLLHLLTRRRCSDQISAPPTDTKKVFWPDFCPTYWHEESVLIRFLLHLLTRRKCSGKISAPPTDTKKVFWSDFCPHLLTRRKCSGQISVPPTDTKKVFWSHFCSTYWREESVLIRFLLHLLTRRKCSDHISAPPTDTKKVFWSDFWFTYWHEESVLARFLLHLLTRRKCSGKISASPTDTNCMAPCRRGLQIQCLMSLTNVYVTQSHLKVLVSAK
jgi:hypothetical protein